MWTNCYLNALLFQFYPRHVSIVYSSTYGKHILVNSYVELGNIVLKYNGVANIYVDIYDLNLVIDKVVFDIDAKNIYDSYIEAIELVKYLTKEDLAYVPVFSGQKGFHIYVLFKPWRAPNEETARLAILSFQNYIIDTLKLKHVDKQMIGSVRHKIRLPNTLRPPLNASYCTYLPRDFIEWDINDIIHWSKSMHCPEYYYTKLRDVREFMDCQRIYEYEAVEIESFAKHSIPLNIVKMLSNLIRPCILLQVLDSDPSHFARTAFVSELVWLDYDVDTIVEIIRRLNWSDFNERITRYHVRKIWEKKLFPPSCRKLREQGLCIGSKCQFYPGIFYWWGSI